MNPFKQALNLMKRSWQNSLILGLTSTAFVFIAWASPLLSSLLISFGVLVFQEIAQRLARDNAWPKRLHLRADPVAYLIITLILLPTSVLLGSSIGMLDSPDALHVAIPSSLGLLVLALYFFFILSQSLRLHFERKLSVARAIDIVGLASLRDFKFYLALSFYSAVLILIAGMTKGVGLIVALPFIFYINHYSYLTMDEKVFSAHAPR